jgi:chemotaxis protein methyltransferase WspC
MGLANIESLLKASMGLNAAAIGPSAIARAVEARVAACHLEDSRAYLQRLRASQTELQELIEAVVVPETWFFRGPESFAALARLAREERRPRAVQPVLHFLSLPCSTGEEPYSMAMALLDASVPADRFLVDAVDISVRALDRARRGEYGRNSFRGEDLAFRDRHFDATDDGHHLHEEVRRQVHFQPGNLFAGDLLPGAGIYDAIFCRNVLIYFDRATQDRAMLVLERLLKPTGVLFVAAAETGLPASAEFAPTGQPQDCAFRRMAPVPRRFSEALAAPSIDRPASTPPSPVHAVRGISPARAAAPEAGLPANLADDLSQAARLADQGHFAEAATLCEALLRRRRPSAGAFYLMGLVRDATSNYEEAVAYYRKALYLDPNHGEAQIHLAFLLEKQGDPGGAQVLRNRAQRLEQRRKASHE